MIDTHIHLDFESYDADRDETIARFFENGGQAMINVGVDEQRIKKSLEIAKTERRIFVAAGFHPQEATDMEIPKNKLQITNKNQKTNPKIQTAIRHLEKLINSNMNKIVAIGEIGLDYYHPSGTDYGLKINDKIKTIQKYAFRAQLDLAKDLGLPVIIHCWDAQDDCWAILKNYQDLEIVFHCYGRGYNLDFTKGLLEHRNVYFSFTGNITFPKPGKAGSEVFEQLKLIPLERIMVETDGPFLAPVPHRGQRNEPSFVKFVIEKIAEIKGISAEEVEKQTDQNAIKFFCLDVK